MNFEKEKTIQRLKEKLSILEQHMDDDHPDVISLKRAIRHLTRASDKRYVSLLRSLIGRK